MAPRDVKVGLFVLASLIVLGVVVMMIGDERQLFARHTEFRAAFKDVNGLMKGSPIRMGGVDIGTVEKLGYGGNADDDTIFVKLSIVESESRRIRVDSIAEVKGKGFLGDKMIVITVGDESLPRLKAGELVKTKETHDLDQIIGDLKNVSAGAERVMEHLETVTESLAQEEFQSDLKKTVTQLSLMTESINSGEGYIGRLLNDGAEANRIEGTIEQFHASAAELEKLLYSARQVMDRVRTGPGLVHEVLYDQGGSHALAQVGDAAEEVGLTLKGIREKKSLVNNILYGEESGDIMKNLTTASSDLQAIVHDVRAGKGTLGAFLSDPSVYEDIKVLLGNVGRNRSLRALVRYSIKQDEASGRVLEPKAETQASSSALSEP